MENGNFNFSLHLASAVMYAPRAIFCTHLAVTKSPKFFKNGKAIMTRPFIAIFTNRNRVLRADVLKYLKIKKVEITVAVGAGLFILFKD